MDIAAYIKQLGIKNDVIDEMTMPFSRVCYATKHNNYLIDYDGSILKCTLSLDDNLNKIGKIYKDGTMEIDDYKHSKWVGKKRRCQKNVNNAKCFHYVMAAGVVMAGCTA